MTTDLSKIRQSLKNCEEVELPYTFPPKCWIKYITIKGEDEAFYEGGQYLGMGDHKILLLNKGKRLTAATCIRSDDGDILYKSRFFIDTHKTDECKIKQGELEKMVSQQQRVIQKVSEQLKLVEDKNHQTQSDYYDLLSTLETKDRDIQDLMVREKKYKLILSQYIR
jgi:hypothetical protein